MVAARGSASTPLARARSAVQRFDAIGSQSMPHWLDLLLQPQSNRQLFTEPGGALRGSERHELAHGRDEVRFGAHRFETTNHFGAQCVRDVTCAVVGLAGELRGGGSGGGDLVPALAQ